MSKATVFLVATGGFMLMVLLVFLALPSCTVQAEPNSGPRLVEIPADDMAIIESPADGSFRVLLAFPDLNGLSGNVVFSARLVWSSLEVEEPLTLEVHPVTRSWSPATVSWNSPWTRAGGDYAELVSGGCRIAPDRGGVRVAFNVSMAARAIVNEGDANHGFVIVPARRTLGGEDTLVGIPSAYASQFASASGAKLVVFCGDA